MGAVGQNSIFTRIAEGHISTFKDGMIFPGDRCSWLSRSVRFSKVR